MLLKDLPPEEQLKHYNRIKKIRKEYKPVNYSAIYGVRPKKLSREMGTSVSKAGQLLDAYWDRNWAVKELVKPLKTKQAGGYTWLYNPVSGFWYQLRFDKDRFSTLNQGTGVYVFDSWLARCAKLGYMGQMQCHDETGASVTDPSQTREIMQQAIEWTNRDLKCHVEFGIDSQTGKNYAECH